METPENPPQQPSDRSLDPRAVPAAIYVRISRDREGAGLGVERQEADCRALADRLGWTVVAVFVDNDISAASGRFRPGYQALLDAVRAGTVRAVLAWHTDRLHRRPVELEEFISLAEGCDLQVQTVKAGDLNLSTSGGRMVARMLGAAARAEVDNTRDRIRRQKQQAATEGRYRGGPRPYGFEVDGTTVREDEAEVIRDGTSAILAGRTLRAVAADLRDRGLLTSTGREWTYSRVRDVLIRPRNAGLLGTGRTDRGEAVIVGKAQWEPIVDEETWRAVYALLTDASRRKQQRTSIRWVGSGIYRCGDCGEPMRCTAIGGTATRRGGSRRYYYRCEHGHLIIRQDMTDEYVLGVVAELVRDDRVRAAMHPQDDNLGADRERRAALLTRLTQFERDYGDGITTAAVWRRQTDRVEAELAEVEARIAEAVRQSSASPVLGAPDPGVAFLEAPVDVQRAVLAAVLRVEVRPRPVDQRGKAWTPDRLRLTPVAAAAAADPPTTSPPGGGGPEPVLRAPAQGLDPDCEGVETHEHDNHAGVRGDPGHHATDRPHDPGGAAGAA